MNGIDDTVYRPGSAARGERAVERPPDVAIRGGGAAGSAGTAAGAVGVASAGMGTGASSSAAAAAAAAASSSAAGSRDAAAAAAVAAAAAGSAAAAAELLTEIPKGSTAKETLQMAMAAREKYDAQLKGAVAAAQEDMLSEVGQLRRTTSLAGRFRTDVEALIAKIEASGGVLQSEVERGFKSLYEIMAAREKVLVEQASGVASGRLGAGQIDVQPPVHPLHSPRVFAAIRGNF